MNLLAISNYTFNANVKLTIFPTSKLSMKLNDKVKVRGFCGNVYRYCKYCIEDKTWNGFQRNIC